MSVRWRGLGAVVVALGMIALTACGGDGPDGPGVLVGTVTSPTAAGAVVLELTGSGIQGIDGDGTTRAFERSTGSETYRVILTNVTAGTLSFEVEVADIGDAPPTTVVLSGVDGANQPLAELGEVVVRYDRR